MPTLDAADSKGALQHACVVGKPEKAQTPTSTDNTKCSPTTNLYPGISDFRSDIGHLRLE